MDTLIIACSMLEDEINLALAEENCRLPVVWLERALHTYPEKLRSALQEEIDKAKADTILLTFGLCGNALAGIRSGTKRLITPKFHDCLHMLVAGEPYAEPVLAPDCLYFTDSWFRSENFIVNEFWQCCKRLGEAKARRAYGAMLRQYAGLTLVDTGAYAMQPARERAAAAADLFKLEAKEEKGTIRVLRKLFSGDWDEEFILIGPGESLTQNAFLKKLE